MPQLDLFTVFNLSLESLVSLFLVVGSIGLIVLPVWSKVNSIRFGRLFKFRVGGLFSEFVHLKLLKHFRRGLFRRRVFRFVDFRKELELRLSMGVDKGRGFEDERYGVFGYWVWRKLGWRSTRTGLYEQSRGLGFVFVYFLYSSLVGFGFAEENYLVVCVGLFSVLDACFFFFRTRLMMMYSWVESLLNCDYRVF